jgi:hypothetical protein
MESRLAERHDDRGPNFQMWTMTSVAHYGELSEGEWTFEVHNFGITPLSVLGYRFQIRGRKISGDTHPHGTLRSVPLSSGAFDKFVPSDLPPIAQLDSEPLYLVLSLTSIIILLLIVIYVTIPPSPSPSPSPSLSSSHLSDVPHDDVSVPILRSEDVTEEEERRGNEERNMEGMDVEKAEGEGDEEGGGEGESEKE